MGSGCQIDTHSTTKHLSAEGRRKQYRSGDLSSPLDQADFLKLRSDDFLVERLHDVLLGTGMIHASSTASGRPRVQTSLAFSPSAASMISKFRPSRIRRATLRITLESSTTRHVFMLPSIS